MAYSRWAVKEEIMEKATQISYDSEIKKSGIELMYDDNHLYIDDKGRHNLIIGTTGSGKTQAAMLPQMRLAIKAGESFVVNDIKGEIYNILSGEVKKRGYNLYVINFANPAVGNNYNPFTIPYKLYKNGNKDDALEMVENIGYYLLSEDKKNANVDPFWENSAINLFTGITLYLFENAKEEEININSIVNLSNNTDELTDYVKTLDKTSLIYQYLSGILFAPKETKGSIISVFRQEVNLYASRENLSKLLSYTNIDFENIQKEKTAIFIISENKSVSKGLISLLIDQCYNIARFNSNTERRLNFYLDDFDNLKAIKELNIILNIAKSNNIVFNIFVKSILELMYIYGKEDTEIIKMSFGNIIYLLANDIETLEQISKCCGNIDRETPLISTEELKTLDTFEAIIISPRIYPIKTKLLPDYQIKWDFEEKAVDIKPLEHNEIAIYKI